MPDPSEKRVGMPPGPPDLQSHPELQALTQQLSHESRRSALIGFVCGAIVVAGLGVTFYAALTTRTTLNKQVIQNDSLQTEVHTKTAEASNARQQVETTKALLSATVENLQAASPAASASATTAIDKAFDSNPAASKLLVRIYIHANSEAQRPRAMAMAGTLRAAGYLVPGIDVQAAQSYGETEVHYYTEDSQSESDVAAISAVLAKEGVPATKRLTAPAQTDRLRARAYGLWLGAGLP